MSMVRPTYASELSPGVVAVVDGDDSPPARSGDRRLHGRDLRLGGGADCSNVLNPACTTQAAEPFVAAFYTHGLGRR